MITSRRPLTDGELRRLRAEWAEGTLTVQQLATRFRIGTTRVVTECDGLKRHTIQADPRRQGVKSLRAL